jgi:hypothetical protein
VTFPALTRRDVWRLLRNERGRPLREVSWTGQFLDGLDDPRVRLLMLWTRRQAGKTTHMVSGVASTLFTRPGAYVVFVSAAERQAEAIFNRKLRRPLEQLARELGIADALRITQRTIEVPELGTAFEFMATNEATAPGRSVDELYIDEGRDVRDSVFEVLAPSVIGVGGKIIVGSTSGRPAGWFYELVRNPPEGMLLIHPEANENPEASGEVLGFLSRLFGLFPAAGRRELQNEFVDDGDELLPAALIEAVVDDRLGEVPSSTRPAFAFIDLSRKRDLSSRAVVLREAPRRPEATDHLVVASVQTWDPKQNPVGEVDFAEIRADLAALPIRFPNLEAILIDEGAEAGAVLPFCRQHPRLSMLVQGFTANVGSNMELWGSLAARLHAQTITLPRHERLLAELRGLRRTEFAFGSKWRVVDSTRRLHRDVSLSLAGACMAAGMTPVCENCGEPGCSGFHVLLTGHASARTAPTMPEPFTGEDNLQPDQDPAADSPLRSVYRRARDAWEAVQRARAHQERMAAMSPQELEGLYRESAAEAAERQERDRAAQWLAEKVRRGGGAWFPND